MVSTPVRTSFTNIPDYIDAHHWDEWKKSCVSDEIIRLNVSSIYDSNEIDKLLNRNTKSRWKHSDGLIPAWRVAGVDPLTDEFTLDGVQVKPDSPPINKDGKLQKYLSPSNYELSPLFLNTGIKNFWESIIEDKTEPVFILEGAKKAGSVLSIRRAGISIPGVSTCRKKGRLHEKLAIFGGFGRTFYIGFDSDILQKAAVQDALLGLARELSSTGSKVMVLELPADTKGVDDYIATYGEEEFNKLVEQSKTIEEYREVLKDNWERQLQEIKTKKRSKLARYADTLRLGWGQDLRYNELKSQCELGGQPLDLNQVRLRIALEFDLDVPVQDAQSIVEMISAENSYHPVENYLDRLSRDYPNPDTSILDDLATRYFGTNYELHNVYLKKTLIASVARVKKPGCKYDTSTILVGKQGVGKSTFWRLLFGDEWFTDELGDSSEKDEMMKLHRFWCLEWSEFETVYKKKDVASLKKFMSSTTDAFRTPYSRSVKEYPRRCVLVGTTNEREILNDPTGSRRFWIIPVSQELPLEKLEEERDRIWAAAYALYQSGERWWLSREESELQEANNQDFQSHDPWLDSIQDYVELKDCVRTPEIFAHLGVEPARQEPVMKRRIASVLRSLGWDTARKYINKSWVRCWEKIRKVEKSDGSCGSQGSCQEQVQNDTEEAYDPLDPHDPSKNPTFIFSDKAPSPQWEKIRKVEKSDGSCGSQGSCQEQVENDTGENHDPLDPHDPSKNPTFIFSDKVPSPPSPQMVPVKKPVAGKPYWSKSFSVAVRVEKVYPSVKTVDVAVTGISDGLRKIAFSDLMEYEDWKPNVNKQAFYGKDKVTIVGGGNGKWQIEYSFGRFHWVKSADLSPVY